MVAERDWHKQVWGTQIGAALQGTGTEVISDEILSLTLSLPPSLPPSQINHKYPERRLLVAESCGALAPYLPVRTSLYYGASLVFKSLSSVHFYPVSALHLHFHFTFQRWTWITV